MTDRPAAEPAEWRSIRASGTRGPWFAHPASPNELWWGDVAALVDYDAAGDAADFDGYGRDFGPVDTGDFGLAADVAIICEAVNDREGLLEDLAAALLRPTSSGPPLADLAATLLALHTDTYTARDGTEYQNTVSVTCADFPGCDGTDETECDDPDDHERPSCSECRMAFEDVVGYQFYPCPTRLAVEAALRASQGGQT